MQTTPISLIDQDHETFFEQLLAPIQAEDILDIACGAGGFTGILANGLKEYRQITGIDISEAAITQARAHHTDPRLMFEVMDAAKLEFPDAAFDLVSCAFSLHHLPYPEKTVSEIRRVLKPDGHALLVEMYCDQLSQTQQTESMLHHWAAEVDTDLGILHRKTYAREEIVEIVEPAGWQDYKVFDQVDLSFDPKGEEITSLVLTTIERVLKKAESLPNYDQHMHLAEQLRQRIQRVGTQISTRLVLLLQK